MPKAVPVRPAVCRGRRATVEARRRPAYGHAAAGALTQPPPQSGSPGVERNGLNAVEPALLLTARRWMEAHEAVNALLRTPKLPEVAQVWECTDQRLQCARMAFATDKSLADVMSPSTDRPATRRVRFELEFWTCLCERRAHG